MERKINVQEIVIAKETMGMKKSVGKVARIHRKRLWTEDEMYVLKCGSIADLKELRQTIYDGPYYCQSGQYKFILQGVKEYGLPVDMDDIKLMTTKEASDFMNEIFFPMYNNAKTEAIKNGPISDTQRDILSQMKLCVSIRFTSDFENLTYGEAYEIIGKYKDVFYKFKKAMPSKAAVEKANHYQTKMGNEPLHPETIAAFADPDDIDGSKKRFNQFIEQLKSEYFTYLKKTTLEPEKKERTREDELTDEEKENNEIRAIIHRLYASIGQEGECVEAINHIDELKDIACFAKEVHFGTPTGDEKVDAKKMNSATRTVLNVFKNAKYFNLYEIAYICDTTYAFAEEVIG